MFFSPPSSQMNPKPAPRPLTLASAVIDRAMDADRNLQYVTAYKLYVTGLDHLSEALQQEDDDLARRGIWSRYRYYDARAKELGAIVVSQERIRMDQRLVVLEKEILRLRSMLERYLAGSNGHYDSKTTQKT